MAESRYLVMELNPGLGRAVLHLGGSQGEHNSLVVPYIEFGAIWVAAVNVGQK